MPEVEGGWGENLIKTIDVENSVESITKAFFQEEFDIMKYSGKLSVQSYSAIKRFNLKFVIRLFPHNTNRRSNLTEFVSRNVGFVRN